MRLLGHFVRTDLRHFRTVAVVFVVLVAAETATELALPFVAGNTRLGLSVAAASRLVWIAVVLLHILLVGLVVQAHPLVGSDAFWMTRPFPPRTLLVSKVVLLALLLIVPPVLCSIVMMVIYQVPPATMAAVSIQSIMIRTFLLVILMSAASLTRSLAGIASLIGGTLLAIALFMIVSATIMSTPMDNEVGMLAVGVNPIAVTTPDATSDVLLLVLLIAAGTLLLSMQYRTRLRRFSVPAGAAAVALAFGIAAIWPWPILQARVSVPGWVDTPAVRLSARAETFYFDRFNEWMSPARRFRSARARVVLENGAPGWEAQVRLAGSTITLADGQRVDGRTVPYGQPVALNQTDDVPHMTVMRDVLGVRRIAGLYKPGPGGHAIVAVVPETDLHAHKGKSGSYRGTFVVELSRVEIAASLPLERGALYREGAERFVIDDVRQADGVSLRIRRSGATTMFNRRPVRQYEYYLRNRRLGEATATWLRPALDSLLPIGLYGIGVGGASHASIGAAFGFGVHPEIVECRFQQQPDDAMTIDRQWLADADLVIVRTTQSGSAVKTLELPEVVIRERPAKTATEGP